jgi:menaquinone-dependent protoporphyrinogen oxidase
MAFGVIVFGFAIARGATMTVLIAYATTEGQTRKIARFCADRLIAQGHSVELLPLVDMADDEALVDMSRFDAAILAGSVHGGRLQPQLDALCRAPCGGIAGAAFAVCDGVLGGGGQ